MISDYNRRAVVEMVLGGGTFDGMPVNQEALDLSLAATATHFNLTVPQLIRYIAIGDIRHEQAPLDECGCVNPRNEHMWCRLPLGHTENLHDCFPKTQE